MRDRECSTATVDWDRSTPVSCLALHSSVSEVGLAQRLVHPFGGVAAHARYPVRVAVESYGDRGVAKQMLDELRMCTTREQQGGAGVPEVVPAYVR
jgi:hypothetical protein